MRIAFVGEVDHGKSSLIGRLMLDTKSLSADKLKEMAQISKDLGEDACLAFLVDQLMEERREAMTIDTTECVLKAGKEGLVCIDTPGHLKFLKNMMTGASCAEAAVVVVDATLGVQDQTRLHTRILKMLGITTVLFAVNKMDLMDYKQEAFRREEDVLKALSQESGLTPQAIIPVSARHGTNILRNSNQTKWYKGPSLWPAMLQLKKEAKPGQQPLRFPVQDIYKDNGHSVIVGRVARGTIHKNQKVMVLPSLQEATIEAIKTSAGEKSSASSGENIGLVCAPAANLKRGDVLCEAGTPVANLHTTRQFEAQVIWLDEVPLKKDESVTVRLATQQFECKVQSVGPAMDNAVYDVILGTEAPCVVEPFAQTPELGRFVVEKNSRRAGAGIITKILASFLICISLFGLNACAYDPDDTALDNGIASMAKGTTGWTPLIIPEEKSRRQANGNKPEDFQSLAYLQAYTPPTAYKGVILYDRARAFLGYNLLIGPFLHGAILMDMNGRTVHKWLYPSASLPPMFRNKGFSKGLILKNGDFLGQMSYTGMLKIDKDSKLLWFKRINCHHDFDLDENGNIYTLTIKNSRYGDNSSMKINSIAVLSPEGQIKKEISLYDLFKKYPDRRYLREINASARTRYMVLADGRKLRNAIPGEVFHANSIQLLDGKWQSKVPAFKKGNVLVDIRNLGMVICVDPVKEEIVWLVDRAYWDRGQHFAKLIANGDILLFDNFYRGFTSRVVEYDPVSKKLVWNYTVDRNWFFSHVMGECYRLPNGNTMINLTDKGHVIEVTPDKHTVWDFYNPIQADAGKHPKLAKRFGSGTKKLLAVIDHMERIPIDSSLDWLKH